MYIACVRHTIFSRISYTNKNRPASLSLSHYLSLPLVKTVLSFKWTAITPASYFISLLFSIHFHRYEIKYNNKVRTIIICLSLYVPVLRPHNGLWWWVRFFWVKFKCVLVRSPFDCLHFGACAYPKIRYYLTLISRWAIFIEMSTIFHSHDNNKHRNFV